MLSTARKLTFIGKMKIDVFDSLALVTQSRCFHSLHRIYGYVLHAEMRRVCHTWALSLSRVCMHSMRLRGGGNASGISVCGVCGVVVKCGKKLIQINRSTRHIFHYHHSLLFSAASLRILIVSFDQISRHKRDIHHSVRSPLYRFPHVYFHDTRISPPLISSSSSSLILLCWAVAVDFMCWFISYSNF